MRPTGTHTPLRNFGLHLNFGERTITILARNVCNSWGLVQARWLAPGDSPAVAGHTKPLRLVLLETKHEDEILRSTQKKPPNEAVCQTAVFVPFQRHRANILEWKMKV